MESPFEIWIMDDSGIINQRGAELGSSSRAPQPQPLLSMNMDLNNNLQC
jgi:hypothetical protein